MSTEEIDILLIDQYLKGALIGKDNEEFEKRVSADSDFAGQLKSMKEAKMAIRINLLEEKLETVKKWEEESLDQLELHGKMNQSDTDEIIEKTKPSVGLRIGWKRIVGIAAAVGLIGAFFWMNRGPSEHERLIAEYIDEHFEHHPSGIVRMRSENTSADMSSLKTKAYNLYDIYSYKEAAPLLERVYYEEGDTISLFYAGVAWLGAGEVERSNEILSINFLNNFPIQKYRIINQKFIKQ